MRSRSRAAALLVLTVAATASLMTIAPTGAAQAATIIAPDPFDGIAGTFSLRFDVAGATPRGEIISEARFTATFRALPAPSPAPLLGITEIPKRVVNVVPVGSGAHTTYRTETIRRVGARPADVAFAIGDLQAADRAGRLGRIELATSPVVASDTWKTYNAYNAVNTGVDLGNCEEDDPSWAQFLFKGPPDDCFATHIDIHETVLTTVTETPNTIGARIDILLTEEDIAFAARNGFVEVSFKGNGRGEIYDPELAFKSVPLAVDPDDGATTVPLPPSAALLAASLAALTLRGRDRARTAARA